MNNKVLIEASKVSFTVVLLVVLIGLLLAMGAVIFIGFNQKKRYRWLEGLFILPMFIPPSAIGYIILMIFGRQGWIGRFLYQMFDISIIFYTNSCRDRRNRCDVSHYVSKYKSSRLIN